MSRFLSRRVLAAFSACGFIACSGGGDGPNDPLAPSTDVVRDVRVAPESIGLTNPGTSASLTAVVDGQRGPISNPVLVWSSSQPAVATVAGTGANAVVTAVSGGTTTITATSGSVSATAIVTVTPVPVRPSIAELDWHAVSGRTNHGVWANGRWFVFGPSGNGFSSPDGIRFTRLRTDPGFTGESVVYTGSRVVVVGSGAFYSDDNGNTWTLASGLPGATLMTTAVWTGTRLIARSSNDDLFTSPDGAVWQPLGNGSVRLRDIVWTGSLLVGGSTSSSTRLMVSTDGGTVWTQSASLPFTSRVSWTGSQLVMWDGQQFGTSTDGQNWTFKPSTINWTTTNRSLEIDRGVFWTGSQYLALGYDNSIGGGPNPRGIVLTSPDGSVWTEVNYGSHFRLTGMARSPNNMLLFGESTLESTNGVDWRMRMHYMFGSSKLEWFGDRFLILNSDQLLTSLDGLTWRRASLANAGSGSFAAAAWTGSQYVVSEFGGAVRTSPDGVVWTTRQTGSAEGMVRFVRGGGRTVGVGGNGTAISSTDGLSWTSRAIGTTRVSDVAYDGQRFVIWGSPPIGGSIPYASVDGLTWQAGSSYQGNVGGRTVATNGGLTAINYANAYRSTNGLQWAAVGNQNLSDPRPEWETASPFNNAIVSCAYSGARLVYSSDGLTWFLASTPEPITGRCLGLAASETQLLVQGSSDVDAGRRR